MKSYYRKSYHLFQAVKLIFMKFKIHIAPEFQQGDHRQFGKAIHLKPTKFAFCMVSNL